MSSSVAWALIVIAVIVVWAIGYWFWLDATWPLTVLLNFLGDLGIGNGTSSGYPWENGSQGVFPHSHYR